MGELGSGKGPRSSRRVARPAPAPCYSALGLAEPMPRGLAESPRYGRRLATCGVSAARLPVPAPAQGVGTAVGVAVGVGVGVGIGVGALDRRAAGSPTTASTAPFVSGPEGGLPDGRPMANATTPTMRSAQPVSRASRRRTESGGASRGWRVRRPGPIGRSRPGTDLPSPLDSDAEGTGMGGAARKLATEDRGVANSPPFLPPGPGRPRISARRRRATRRAFASSVSPASRRRRRAPGERLAVRSPRCPSRVIHASEPTNDLLVHPRTAAGRRCCLRRAGAAIGRTTYSDPRSRAARTPIAAEHADRADRGRSSPGEPVGGTKQGV
jgi:hypothetical protein